MKFNFEIIISAVVLYLLYTKPPILTRYANTILGKVILLMGVMYVANNMGKLAGLLAALVMIVLIYDNVEGFTPDNKDKEDNKKIEHFVEALTEKEEKEKKIEAMTEAEKAIDDMEDIKTCNNLKKKLEECSKENGCFDLSGYDVRCVEGNLRISSNKNTVNSSK